MGGELMPNGMEVSKLDDLASVREPAPMATGDKVAMSATPTARAPAPEPSGAGQDQDQDAVFAKVGNLFKELANIAQAITQADPRTTMLVKDSVQKLYLGISKIYGVEEEVKLAMKKGQGQMQSQGMGQMGGMT